MSTLSMIQRIESEKKDLKLGEIKDLVLDGCSSTEVEGLTDEYSSLETLSMVGVGLTSLAGLPALPALKKLNVSENPITGGLDAVAKCTNLVSINLSGNKLSQIGDLAPMASLDSLCSLELNDCALVGTENYRKEVFAVLPQLMYLDGLDANGDEDVSGSAKHVADNMNGANNGHCKEETDEDDDESDEEEDEDEEIGISALQGSKDLDDDEEDYVPGEEDDVDEGDDVEGDEDDEDEVDETETEVIANLSGAGVTGSRRTAKRAAEDEDSPCVSEAKHVAPDASGDAE